MPKKIITKMLLGIFLLLSIGSFAQNSSVYNAVDSNVISSKGKSQQDQFMNNTYDFPAKPRNELEVGISGGLFSVSGDVAAKLPTAGFDIHIRKALGYLFSVRAEYLYGSGKGLNWKPSYGYSNNPVWAGYSASDMEKVYYNYRTHVQDLSLQGIFTLNNIRFHKQKTGLVLYAGAGFGATIYDTKVQVPNSFSSINAGTGYANRKEIRKQLEDLLKDVPYTEAENNRAYSATLFGQTLRPSGSVLGGIAFKLGNRVNLAIEDRVTFIKDDLLDGQQWQEHPLADPAQTRDFDTYNYASIGLNFNLGSKAVQPLWWVNPLDYAYSEINNPKHMKIPPPVFVDSDGDGVPDQLDKEPNTPAGCPVDVHGVALDTDGDGVPDCKDKQLITPTECQPVDADGVGKCPDPECCKNILTQAANNTCNLGDLPSIQFRNGSANLSTTAEAMLATIAVKLKTNPSCTIMVVGYPAITKTSQIICNKRTTAVKNYLSEKEGISAERINFNYVAGGGDINVLDIQAN